MQIDANKLEDIQFDEVFRPQDDLFRFVNGKWLETTPIPDDKPRWGSFDELHESSLNVIRELLEGKEMSESKCQKLYNSVMNLDAIEAVGSSKLQEILQSVVEIDSWDELLKWNANELVNRQLPYNFGVSNDLNNPDYNTVHFAQGGLSLPEKAYYYDEQHKNAKTEFIVRLQELIDIISPQIANSANLIEFETKIAEFHWDIALTRDIEKINNPIQFSQFAEKYSNLLINDAICYKMSANHNKTVQNLTINVEQPDYFENISQLWCEKYFTEWKNWTIIHLIMKYAGYMNEAVENASFRVNQVFTGANSKPPRWKKAVNIVNSFVGDDVGRVYVEKYYPEDARIQMSQMIEDLKSAYKISITNAPWLKAKTREKALEKLSKFRAEIGFPQHWHEYFELQFSDDLFVNYQNYCEFAYFDSQSKIGELVDKKLWHMTPQTVNAYYNPPENVIVFPAAILQPPFFDLKRDKIMNYGAIGAVIGHEIGHGFDDQGSMFDGDGKVNNWWTDEDKCAFDAITSKLAKQFSEFTPKQLLSDSPLPKVNGQFTTGENVGDVSGLKIALLAFAINAGYESINELTLKNAELVRKFFYAFALIWRNKSRDEYARMLLSVDPHSPAEFRANTVRNLDAFHAVFETKVGDALHLPKDQRIDLW